MTDQPPAPLHDSKPSRRWIAWAVLAATAAAVATSFAFSPADDTPGKSGDKSKPAPVAVATVERDTVIERGRYPGELDADAADVSSFYAGRLVSVSVRVGDTVAENDALAELDPVDAKEQIAQAHAQAKAAAAEEQRAKVERDAAATDLARAETLVKDQLIPAQELDRRRANAAALGAAVESAAASGAEARARVRLLEKRIVESVVRAPFAGRIAERYVDPGAIVAAGAPLVRVVQVSPLRVRFEVPEHELTGIVTGAKVEVATRGKTAQATITGVGSEVSRDRRVVTVEALVEAPPEGWLPGMYADASISRRTIADALVVPGSALLSRLEASGTVSSGVFVAAGDVARWTPVAVVARDGDRVAVEAPTLSPGTAVLVGGHTDLKDGARIARDEAPPSAASAAPSAP